jgi:hypothetical protein
MSRGPATFRQRDLTAAIKGALAADFDVRRVEIHKDGKIVLESSTGQKRAGGRGGWDAALLAWEAAHSDDRGAAQERMTPSSVRTGSPTLAPKRNGMRLKDRQ